MPDVTAATTVGGLGEWGVIAAVTRRLAGPPHPLVAVGPGDDAAVLGCHQQVVATVDVLVEGVHFRRDWSSGYDVGRKAAAANLADVAAMGGRGTALLVGLVAPADLAVDFVLALADGLRDEAALVDATVVGGDTVEGPCVMVSVTALGVLEGVAPVLRSGARPGEIIVVAGGLGRSGAGLAQLRAGATSGRLVDAHRRPTPPYSLGPVLARLGASAMCDVSDGLVADLGHIATASGVAMQLDAALLDTGEVSLNHVLHGGEDHALLATVPASVALPAGCRRIGVVTTGGPGVLLDGVPVSGGWEHYG